MFDDFLGHRNSTQVFKATEFLAYDFDKVNNVRKKVKIGTESRNKACFDVHKVKKSSLGYPGKPKTPLNVDMLLCVHPVFPVDYTK